MKNCVSSLQFRLETLLPPPPKLGGGENFGAWRPRVAAVGAALPGANIRRPSRTFCGPDIEYRVNVGVPPFAETDETLPKNKNLRSKTCFWSADHRHGPRLRKSGRGCGVGHRLYLLVKVEVYVVQKWFGWANRIPDCDGRKKACLGHYKKRIFRPLEKRCFFADFENR